jgi:hypothetical protein
MNPDNQLIWLYEFINFNKYKHRKLISLVNGHHY